MHLGYYRWQPARRHDAGDGRALKNNDTIEVGNTKLELVSIEEAHGDEQTSATAATVLDGGARAGGVLIVRKGPTREARSSWTRTART
ncbi:MAG: hypothetical protein ACOC5K_02355 [Chloroflexota bacterium]